MYHQLNKISGRLIPATNLQAPLFPIVPRALQRVEAPKIEYNTTQFSTISKNEVYQTGVSRVPGSDRYYSTVPENIRKKQELFQQDNDVPVFLKGGPSDAILYRLTLALCGLGLIGVADLIYSMAFPKKPQ